MEASDVRERGRRSREELRSRSKKLFGNADRVEVVNAVARAPLGVVHAQALSDQLGITPPRVRTQLLAMCDAGLLEALPKAGGLQQYERRRSDDPYWTLIERVAEEWG